MSLVTPIDSRDDAKIVQLEAAGFMKKITGKMRLIVSAYRVEV